MFELVILIVYGEEALQINALEHSSMVVKELQMETIISILSWVENLQLYYPKIYYMVEFKLGQSFLKGIGYGQLFGYFLDIISMDNGQLVAKSILWKVEEM